MTFSGPLQIEVEGDVYLTPISESFGLVDAAFIRRVFRERAQMLASRLSTLIESLSSGELGTRAFVRQSMRALQQTYYTVFSLGALSVDSFHVLTDEDIRELNRELLGERRFLQSFARDLSRGTLEVPPAARAKLYLGALRGVFELGRWMALPDRPLDWVLGDTDHCEPCILASLSGPYKKTEFSLLDLPVIPGIPGSGEVCKGLTRCGCTTRLAGFPVNERLQLQLRDILAGITMEV